LEELQKNPKKGYVEHHNVEQWSEKDDIPRSLIDADENRVRIPRMKHWEMNGWLDTSDKEFGDAQQLANDLSKKILAGNANAAQRFVFDADQGALGGGVMVRTYLNKFSMAGPKVLDIRVHPNMPAGALLMTSRTLPYPLSNVGNVVQVRTRQDYYQIEWPPRARRYETGVYADEVLQHYFPPSMAVIANIAAG
jgi:hypothetical protein